MSRGRALKLFVLAALMMLMGAAVACGNGDTGTDAAGETETPTGEVSATLGDVPDTVEGNVVTIPVNIDGIEIVPADGDTSGETGHFHVFVDSDPPDEGDTIPVGQPGIIHSAENPIKLWGMAVGEHTIHVVLGNGAHTRIEQDIDLTFEVDVEGPSVDGTAPATLDEGETLEIELASEGVEIRTADGDRSGESGHYHVLVDPESPPEPKDVIPEASENEIVHTTEDSVEIEGLAKGAHTIWVVLGDGTHTAFDPVVMDKLTVTVG